MLAKSRWRRTTIARWIDFLARAGINYSSKEFKRVASARTLYHWNAEAGQEY